MLPFLIISYFGVKMYRPEFGLSFRKLLDVALNALGYNFESISWLLYQLLVANGLIWRFDD